MVWQAPDEIQQKVRKAVDSAQDQSSQSKRLLDIAKRAVELAIETSEDEATAWLDEQTGE